MSMWHSVAERRFNIDRAGSFRTSHATLLSQHDSLHDVPSAQHQDLRHFVGHPCCIALLPHTTPLPHPASLLCTPFGAAQTPSSCTKVRGNPLPCPCLHLQLRCAPPIGTSPKLAAPPKPCLLIAMLSHPTCSPFHHIPLQRAGHKSHRCARAVAAPHRSCAAAVRICSTPHRALT